LKTSPLVTVVLAAHESAERNIERPCEVREDALVHRLA
jgi:hypothetical protein